MVAYALNLLRAFWHDDRAQDAFEYLLVIGGVSVLLIVAMVTPLGTNIIYAVINGVCSAINQIITIAGGCNFQPPAAP